MFWTKPPKVTTSAGECGGRLELVGFEDCDYELYFDEQAVVLRWPVEVTLLNDRKETRAVCGTFNVPTGATWVVTRRSGDNHADWVCGDFEWCK